MFLYKLALLWALLNICSLSAKAKPQDPSVFEDVAKGGLMTIGNMAETFSNNAMISKSINFELPFAKANSETKIGAGGAMRNNDDSDEDSSEEIRRKRALDLDTNAPCHTGSNGGTGDDDVDIQEARRRAYNRMRQAAAKRAKKVQQNARKAKKKYLTSTDDADGGGGKVQQLLVQRRKRQAEVDDLNANMTNGSNNFSQYAQQFSEKLSNIFQGFMNSIAEIAQQLKQKLGGGGGAAPENNEEV